MFDLNEHSHRRFNPLTREWVIVSPHRTKRPWQGQTEKPKVETLAEYDAECYLCPGNRRAGDKVNPNYDGVFVFDNDFAALMPDIPAGGLNEKGLLVAERERGVSRVVCFSPNHSLNVARMAAPDIRRIVDCWADQYSELGSLDFIKYVQIFENRGEMMGASNPHPHCQIWATENVSNEPAKEIEHQSKYFYDKASCLLCDYLTVEKAEGVRIVFENEFFSAVVPFWAVYPFEIMILSANHRGSLAQFDEAEKTALADIMKHLTTRYDNLFMTPFPYSMGLHQMSTDGGLHEYEHFHVHFFPPLLRSATIRKFLVGFELLGSPQRDITPEAAAARLRDLSEVHYLER